MYLVTCELAATSGLNEDSVVNTFAFAGAGAHTAAEAADLCHIVQDLFNADTAGAASSLGNLIAGSVSRVANAHTTRAYALTGRQLEGAKKNDPPTYAGSPIYEETWSLDAVGSVNPALPQEVALVLTLHGSGAEDQPVEGANNTRPRARRTGRVYYGPFDSGQLSSSVDPRPTAGLITRVLDASENMHTASVALGNEWGVWSRSNAAHYPMTRISVANDWDTQRRRGSKPTARTSRTVFP